MYYTKQYYLPLYATDTKLVKPTRTSRNLSNAVSKRNSIMTKSDVGSLQRLFSVPIPFDPNTTNKVDCILYLLYSTLVYPFWHILKLHLNILFTI